MVNEIRLEQNEELKGLIKNFNDKKIARAVYNCKQKFFMSSELKTELAFLRYIFDHPEEYQWSSPIAHLIPRDPEFTAADDSSLYAAGGYYYDLKFWLYFYWPPEVQQRTLKYFTVKVKDPDSPSLISIYLLEYATIIVTYAAATTALLQEPSLHQSPNPYPTLLLKADNMSALSWMRKAANTTPAGRALSRLLCSIQINNRLGLNGGFISSVENFTADSISRYLPSTSSVTPCYSSLFQEHPRLELCRMFQMSSEMQSCLLHALLLGQKVDTPLPRMLGHFVAAKNST